MGNMPRIVVKYNGLFDFDGLYAAIIDWAKNYGYMWHEKTYKHKVPSPAGAEQEFEWQMNKEVDQYVKHSINLKVHMWELTEVQVEVGDKQKTLSNARLYIWIEGDLVLDQDKIFKNRGKFAGTLGKWYRKLRKKDFDSVYGDAFYYRLWNLQALIKKYFDMQTKKHEYKGYLGEN
tara:strand:+ start:997 stop:1524 length:528 start_codon:yes stop_codon:yes gene_type:complete